MHAGFDRFDGLLKITMWKNGLRGISSSVAGYRFKNGVSAHDCVRNVRNIYYNPEDMKMQNKFSKIISISRVMLCWCVLETHSYFFQCRIQ